MYIYYIKTIHDKHCHIILSDYLTEWRGYIYYKPYLQSKYIKNWLIWTKKSKLLKESEEDLKLYRKRMILSDWITSIRLNV